MKWDLVSHHIQKSTQNATKGLSITPETVKSAEENIGERLHGFYLGNDFMDRASKAQAMRLKLDVWDHIRLSRFCPVKKTP